MLISAYFSCGSVTNGVEAETSSDAGRYLCEFSFYRALWATAGRAIFVHVPQLDQPYSKVQLAKAIVVVASEVVSQAKNLH
jgi:pyroglutamyl-peptidase